MPNRGRYYRPSYGNQAGGYAIPPQGQNVAPLPSDAPEKQFTQDFYVYSVNIPSLTTGATNIQSIQIQADSDFEWIMATVSANESGETEPFTDAQIIPITVLITDAGSGRQLFSIPVPVATIAGTGKQPFILPVPRTFKSKSTITLAFTSISANTWQNFYFDLIGRKIFDVTPT